MEAEIGRGELASAFDRLLSECHPLALARAPVDAGSDQWSSGARHLWQQLIDGGWLDLGASAMQMEIAQEVAALGAVAGRHLLALPLAFTSFVARPLMEADPAVAPDAFGSAGSARPVSGRLDLHSEASVIPIDYFGKDVTYIQVVLGASEVFVRRLCVESFIEQGLDAGVRVAMIRAAPPAITAEYRLSLESHEVIKLLRPYFVFQYAHMVGAAEASLQLAIAYAKERAQFGRPIGQFQAVKHALGNAWVAVDNARHAIEALSRLPNDETNLPEFLKITDRITATGAKLATKVSIQVHGAIGFAWEHDCHLYLKRVYRCAAQLTALVNQM